MRPEPQVVVRDERRQGPPCRRNGGRQLLARREPGSDGPGRKEIGDGGGGTAAQGSFKPPCVRSAPRCLRKLGRPSCGRQDWVSNVRVVGAEPEAEEKEASYAESGRTRGGNRDGGRRTASPPGPPAVLQQAAVEFPGNGEAPVSVCASSSRGAEANRVPRRLECPRSAARLPSSRSVSGTVHVCGSNHRGELPVRW